MSANQHQVGGKHYKESAIQPWDYIVSNGLGFLDGNVVKYVTRYREKGGIEDLEKAKHYIEKLIEVENKTRCEEMEELRSQLFKDYVQEWKQPPAEKGWTSFWSRCGLPKNKKCKCSGGCCA